MYLRQATGGQAVINSQKASGNASVASTSAVMKNACSFERYAFWSNVEHAISVTAPVIVSVCASPLMHFSVKGWAANGNSACCPYATF